jgi:hypothetical protein
MAKVTESNKLILFNYMIKNNNNKQVFFLNNHDDMDKKIKNNYETQSSTI